MLRLDCDAALPLKFHIVKHLRLHLPAGQKPRLFNNALDHNLDIVPVINKIDLPSADPERVKAEIEDVIGLPAQDAADNFSHGRNCPGENVPSSTTSAVAPVAIILIGVPFSTLPSIIRQADRAHGI